MRSGTVALLGRTNVGKSTFLNAALGERLAIVSSRPQTTRDALLGIVHRPEAQIAFVDTPGLHRPRTELGRRMNAAARDAARATDAVILMTDVGTLLGSRKGAARSPLHEEDAAIYREVPTATKVVVVINKIDLLRDKLQLLPLIAAWNAVREPDAIVPVSALTEDGVERVIEAVVPLLPEGPPAWEPDALTDRPTRFFAREFVREQVLEATRGEVPHAVAVSIDEIREAGESLSIRATLHVEKAGQRGILVGQGGAQIKAIGTAARLRLQELAGKRVHLELFVRVTPRWKDVPRQLAELGYDAPTGGAGDAPAPVPEAAAGASSRPRRRSTRGRQRSSR
ncbi:MAG: GTPase Era [Deltaproteobacteria bacterium]|nr:GTPase Era [Deltaproteobacteria bacterium]